MTSDVLAIDNSNSAGGSIAPVDQPTSELKTAHDQMTVKVCHVSMCLLTGGLERLLVDFSRLGDASQFELHFAALGELGEPAEDILAAGCFVDSMRHGQVSKLQLVRNLARFFQDHQIDLVHTHNTYAHFYGAVAARLAGVQVVVNSQHGRGCGRGWKARMQFRIANRTTQRIVGVSHDAAELCRGEDRRSADKIIAIHNGIDLNRFEFQGPVSKPVAISVARLSPEKDFSTLLKAVSLARQTVPEFRLQIVGDGQEMSRLRSQVQELEIEGHVEFLGERNDVADLLTKAGFFASSSLTEGISLTLLEAMAVGLPVLTTAVGGNPEIVVDGQTGRLVPAGESEALAEGIIQMCHDADAWQAMGQLGRQRVEQHFNIRKMIAEYESLYRELLTPISKAESSKFE